MFKPGSDDILHKLRSWEGLETHNGHNAAVVLATPDQARRITDDAFMGELARVFAGSGASEDFHILTAAVDHIAPPMGSFQPFQGLSILRGNVEEILPHVWQPSPPKSREDANAQSALEFGLGRPSVTVPVANTSFQNQRDSTLIASHYDFSGSQNQLVRRLEKTSQRISVPIESTIEAVADLGLWLPLSPITHARRVTGSFGNIIKGIEVHGAAVPASTELEDAVAKVFQRIPAHARSGPIGVWAMVTPADVSLDSGPPPTPLLEEFDDTHNLVNETAEYLKSFHDRGGRLYKIRTYTRMHYPCSSANEI